MADKKTITVRVRDMDTIIFEGEVDRISSFNEAGPFDIFPTHANFISIIQKGLTLYNKNAKLKELKIEQAILKVKQDIAHIFLGIETLALEDETRNSQIQTASKNK